MPAQTQAVSDVLLERQKQQTQNGYTSKHDDDHTEGQLAQAAVAYALAAQNDTFADIHWPEDWQMKFYKPRGQRENLVRAAALLLAEIDRIDRAEKRTPA